MDVAKARMSQLLHNAGRFLFLTFSRTLPRYHTSLFLTGPVLSNNASHFDVKITLCSSPLNQHNKITFSVSGRSVKLGFGTPYSVRCGNPRERAASQPNLLGIYLHPSLCCQSIYTAMEAEASIAVCAKQDVWVQVLKKDIFVFTFLTFPPLLTLPVPSSPPSASPPVTASTAASKVTPCAPLRSLRFPTHGVELVGLKMKKIILNRTIWPGRQSEDVPSCNRRSIPNGPVGCAFKALYIVTQPSRFV